MIENTNTSICVFIRVYNSERFIKEAIESIFKQDCRQAIYINILYDEGTTDNSLKILENLVPNEKIKINIIKHPHTTAPLAILYAKRDKSFECNYYCFLDYDNYYEENYLTEAINYMVAHGIDFLFSPIYIVDYKGSVKEKALYKIQKFPKQKILRYNFIDMNTIILSKKAFFYIIEKLTTIDKQYFYWFHEDWIIGALALYNFRYGMLESTYVYYRWHDNNINFHNKNLEHGIIKTLNTRLLLTKLLSPNLTFLGRILLYLNNVKDISYLFFIFLKS